MQLNIAQPKMQTETHISICVLCQLASIHKKKAFGHGFHVSLHSTTARSKTFNMTERHVKLYWQSHRMLQKYVWQYVWPCNVVKP